MKTIKKLKLITLSKKERELEGRQMSALKGGYVGRCFDTRCNCGSNDPANISSSHNWLIA
jgi:natural product precursor